MPNKEHLKILIKGTENWNRWRKDNPNKKPDLNWADLTGVNLAEVNLIRAELQGVNLTGVSLDQAKLHGADLQWAILPFTSLQGVDLQGADLRKADLRKADLKNANLRRANLQNAKLQGAILENANLEEADLLETNMVQAKLQGAKLLGCTLANRDLSSVNLSGSNLSNVDFRFSNLTDCILDGSVMTGARLFETQRSGWSIKGVKCEYAYWDKEGEIKTDYIPGKFESAFSEISKDLHAAVLFIDIKEYSKMDRDLQREAERVLLGHCAMLGKRYEAKFPKTWGDAYLGVFENPDNALEFALKLSKHLAVDGFKSRIGLSHGLIEIHGDPEAEDVTPSGSVFTEAARLEPLAQPGEVLITDSLHAHVDKSRFDTERVTRAMAKAYDGHPKGSEYTCFLVNAKK
ncbi:MAG TPA: hypothetical protein EYQ50_19255 [Verrucomicrobiales bacterium]|nr:hypothetical protein [Verrucomicrobiales bacterium]HIL72315.1 hypothetical protein [Verrucomicrobiota bacterium]